MQTVLSHNITELLDAPASSAIRRMFEEGAALKKRYGAEQVFDFSIGNPDLEPPEAFVQAIEAGALDKTPLRHGYMPNAGYDFARAAMAKKAAAEQGVPVDFSHIVMASGAAGALNVVLKALLNPGDEVLTLCPHFPEYDHYIRNHGGCVRRIRTKPDFSLDAAAIQEACSRKTAAIIINSPNNPTGRIYQETELAELTAVLRAAGKKYGRLPFIIADEPYRAIVYDGKQVPQLFPVYENTVTVTSFAKNFSIAGERIGYIAVNPACPLAARLVASCIFSTRILGFVNAPAFFQKAVAKSWDAPCDYAAYARRRALLLSAMDASGLSYAKPDGAFYLFVKVPDAWQGDDEAFTQHLKKFNILCVPGTAFGYGGWFRISYCVPEQTIAQSKAAFYKAAHV